MKRFILETFFLLTLASCIIITNYKFTMVDSPETRTFKNDNEFYKFLTHELLQEVESDNSLIITDMTFTSGSKAGDNYMSNLKRVTFVGYRGNGEGYLKTFIAKKILANDEHSAFFDYQRVWSNEINVYKHVIPHIETACGTKLHYPKLIYGDQSHILLEDLKPRGYLMVHRRTGLDYDHSKLAMEEIANFHSGWLIIREGDEVLYKSIIEKLGDKHPYQEQAGIDGAIPLIKNAVQMATKRLEEPNTKKNNKYTPFIKYLQNIYNNGDEIITNLITTKKSNLTVMTHGDFYINNFMFSYNEDGTVKDMMLVDYQGTRLSNLTADLHYMIYSSIQPAVRRTHLDNLLQHYHNRVCENLMKSGLFEEDFFKRTFTFEAFLKAFSDSNLIGLISALTLLPNMTYDPDNVPKMKEVSAGWKENKSEEIMDQYYTDALTERLEDIAEEFINRNWCTTI